MMSDSDSYAYYTPQLANMYYCKQNSNMKKVYVYKFLIVGEECSFPHCYL